MSSPQIATNAQSAPESAGRAGPGGRVRVVAVGGVDPGGGAGLLRDVATAAALGAEAVAVGTAWTEQGSGIHRVEPRDPAAVRAALERAVEANRAGAVKIGMAVGALTAGALVDALVGYEGPVVVDPVLASTRGGLLWADQPAAMLPLLRRASLVTPNAPEAAAFLGRAVRSTAEAAAAGRALVCELGLRAVLVKGGHLEDPAPEGAGVATDVLVTPAEVTLVHHRRIGGASPRGTGCALATAIAIGLARRQSLAAAVETAASWLANAISAARPVNGELHLGDR